MSNKGGSLTSVTGIRLPSGGSGSAVKDDKGFAVSAEWLCFCTSHSDVQFALNRGRQVLEVLTAQGGANAKRGTDLAREFNLAQTFVTQMKLVDDAYAMRNKAATAQSQVVTLTASNAKLVGDNATLQARLADATLDTLAHAYLALNAEINPMITNTKDAAIDAMLRAYPDLTLNMIETRAAELAQPTNTAATVKAAAGHPNAVPEAEMA